MRKEITNKEIQEYLKKYADDKPVGMIAADIAKRERYIGDIAVVTDIDQPLFIFDVKRKEKFNEEETKAAVDSETPKILFKDDTDITYACANCGQQYTQEKAYRSNFCGQCGQRFVWEE